MTLNKVRFGIPGGFDQSRNRYTVNMAVNPKIKHDNYLIPHFS